MIPEFELWVKASNIDKMSKGACPLCHQWYMVAYILAENKLASFKVITVPENCPPKILKEKSTSGLFPVVVGVSGETHKGPVENLVADESSELEQFFDSFKCPLLMMNSPGQTVALDSFVNIYRIFNLFLKTNTDKLRGKLDLLMKRLDDHLKDTGSKYLDGDLLTYADCVLLPRLQHVRVAGKIYGDYEIPADLIYLWRYLKNSYHTDAFLDTCPSDPVIINHYQKKAQRRGIEATLMKDRTTLDIPDYIVFNFEEPSEVEETEETAVENGDTADGSTTNGDTKEPAVSEEVAPAEAAPVEVASDEAVSEEVAPAEAAPVEVASAEVANDEAAPVEVASDEAAPVETKVELVEAIPAVTATVVSEQSGRDSALTMPQ